MSKGKVTSREANSKASKSASKRTTGSKSRKPVGCALSPNKNRGTGLSKAVAKAASKAIVSRNGKTAKSVAGSSLARNSSKTKRSVFLRTARSLNLEGPADWSSRFEDYHSGRKS